jgi:hypothetical protein
MFNILLKSKLPRVGLRCLHHAACKICEITLFETLSTGVEIYPSRLFEIGVKNDHRATIGSGGVVTFNDSSASREISTFDCCSPVTAHKRSS